MSTNNGGPAFPVMPPVDISDQLATGYPMPDTGMTLRDYFAAKAMQGFMAQANYSDEEFRPEAAAAYRVADAMLAERSKGAA